MVSSAAKSEPVAEAAQPAAAEPLPGSSATLRLPQEWRLTTDCLLELSELNEALSFERNADGALVISPPPGNPQQQTLVLAGRSNSQLESRCGRRSRQRR